MPERVRVQFGRQLRTPGRGLQHGNADEGHHWCYFGSVYALLFSVSVNCVPSTKVQGACGANMHKLVLILIFYFAFFQTIATGMWTILETILFGILLLYLAVSISKIFKNFWQNKSLYRENRCWRQPWLTQLPGQKAGPGRKISHLVLL